MAEAAIAVAVGTGVSAVGQLVAGQQASRAAEGAARAQLSEERGARAQAVAAAEPSPEELAALAEANRVNQTDIARKERVLASIDPALIEAGNQALKLLRGEEASAIQPFRNARAEAKQQLESQLRAQLGPDYANSSAGIRALARFDSETALGLSQVQDQALARVSGLVTTGAQLNNLSTNIQAQQNLGSLFGNISGRRVSAITGTPIQNAGANFVGEAIGANTLGNVFGTIGQGAATFGMLQGFGQQQISQGIANSGTNAMNFNQGTFDLATRTA